MKGIVICIILATGLVLASLGALTAMGNIPRAKIIKEGEVGNITIIHFADYGVTCWVYKDIGGRGISCIPDEQLKRNEH